MKYLLICVLLHPVFALNYSEDISPIIYNNCTTCHRSGEIGAFLPLTNYLDVFNNRDLIAYAIEEDDERHGQETIPTYFHYHQKERPFHIDYCFLSKSLIDRLKKIEIRKYDDWMKYSDHVPMIIDF